MAWGGFILTNAGRNLLAKVQAGTIAGLNITRFGIGDGTYAGSYSTITNLVSQKQSVPLRTKKAKDQFTNIDGYFSNEGLLTGFYFKEWGIFAMDGLQEILYAYDNAGDDAEYIAPDGNVRYEKMLKAALSISANIAVTINTEGVILATKEEIDNIAGTGRTTETIKGNAENISQIVINKSNKQRAITSKTAAYTVTVADLDTNITVTGNTTITLTDIVTLKLGFRCRISNIGTGIITVVPTGTNTIAKGTSITIYPGKCVEVVADYADMWTVVGFDFTEQINSLDAEVDTHKTDAISEVVIVTRDLSLTGNQVVSGFSKVPKRLDIIASVGGTSKFSIGNKSSSGQFAMMNTTDVGTSGITTGSIALGANATNYVYGVVVINADKTITITWTNGGSGTTGTAAVRIVAHYHD